MSRIVLSDFEKISNRLTQIALLADTGTPEEYLECFTKDAVWDLRSADGLPIETGRIAGHEDLLRGVLERRRLGIQGPGSFTAHEVTNIYLEIDGEKAQARSLIKYYSNLNKTPKLEMLGRYTDTFVRESGAWLLQYRLITRD